jgi:Phycobilisome degradation protein nblA
MNTLTLGLSLEQQFFLRLYEQQVTKLSQDQAQEFLIEMIRQMMVKDNVIRSLTKFGLG